MHNHCTIIYKLYYKNYLLTRSDLCSTLIKATSNYPPTYIKSNPSQSIILLAFDFKTSDLVIGNIRPVL